MTSELKPCNWCGAEVPCTDQACPLNTRATPSTDPLAGLVRYAPHDIPYAGSAFLEENTDGEYVLHSEAAKIVAAKDEEIEQLRDKAIIGEYMFTPQEVDELVKRAEAAESELAQIKAQEPVAWKPVKGFENLYLISNTGDLMSCSTGKIQSKNLAGMGYVKAELWKNGKRKQTYVHRLVASAFVKGSGDEVNHKDGNKLNNNLQNLEWCSRSENVNHGYYELGHLIKSVFALSPAGEINEYRSVREAVRHGFKSEGIYRCLKKKGNTHYGFMFFRSEEDARCRPQRRQQ